MHLCSLEMDKIQRLYFTKDNVDKFLVQKVKFPDWNAVLEGDKLEFLTRLQQKHTTNIYFHNTAMASVPPESRAAPTLEELIANGFSGQGGCCFQLNYFLHLILVALEFDTIAIAGTVAGCNPNCHLMVVVRFGESEEYLLDVASAQPLDTPVPLHQLPYQRFINIKSGISYEYRQFHHKSTVKVPDGDNHARFQKGGSLIHGEHKMEEPIETLRTSFSKIPRTFEFFKDVMHEIFTDPSIAPFLRMPFLFRYLKHEYNQTEEGAEWILVFGFHVVICGKHKREVTTYTNYTSIEEIVWKYFPNVDKGQLQEAMKIYEHEAEAAKEVEPEV